MNENEAKAVAAVKEFNRIRFNLSGFASAMAGKRVEVKASVNTYTTGDVIYIRPQMALASRPDHDRINCEKLGDDYQMICPGCQRIEELYSDLYHELGHIIFNSLNWEVQPKEYAQQVRELGIKYWDENFGNFLYNKMQDNGHCQSVDIARNLDPTIGAGWNFFEDYRMEECVGLVRPGFITMTWNTTETIIRSGDWQSESIDKQLHVVWFFAHQGHNVEEFFSPEVTKPVREFIAECDEPLNNPMDSVLWSIAFYGFMKKRGFFQKEDDGKPEQGDSGGEQQQSGERQSGEQQSGGSTGRDNKSNEASLDANNKGTSDSQDSSQNEGGENESNTGNDEHDNSNGNSDGNNDSQSRQGVSQSDGSTGSDNGNGSDDTKDDISGNSSGDSGQNSSISSGEIAPTPGQINKHLCGIHDHHKEIELGSSIGEFDIESDDQISDQKLEAIVSQAEFYDEYCSGLGPVTIEDPLKSGHGGTQISEPDISAIQPSVIHARRVFSDSKMNKHVRSLKKGKIDGGILGKRAWGEDERIFRKKIKPEGVDFEVCVGMDMSSSTAMNGSFRSIVQIGYSTAELLSRVGVDFSLWGHRTIRDGRLTNQFMFACKEVNEPWSNSSKEKCLSIRPGNGSLDGHNFEFYRKVLQRSRARKKLLIYFTDGVIPETNKAQELPILRREFKMLKRLDIATLGVGILTDSPKDVGMDCVHVSDPSNLTAVLKEIEKRIDHAK